MNATLTEEHPVQAVMGGILISEKLARDADNGEMLVDDVAKDGVITRAEAKQLRAHFSEIGTEAREGRII